MLLVEESIRDILEAFPYLLHLCYDSFIFNIAQVASYLVTFNNTITVCPITEIHFISNISLIPCVIEGFVIFFCFNN